MGIPVLRNLSIMMMILLTGQGCATGSNPTTAVISGTVRLVGNEPFAHLVLVPGDNPDKTSREQSYLLVGPFAEKLKKHYQARKITLEGSMCVSPTPEFSRCFRPTGIKAEGIPRE